MKIITNIKSHSSFQKLHQEINIEYSADYKRKGHEFEEYIVTLFDKESGRFKLLEWRSDKIASNGIYPLSNLFPDLEFSCRIKNGQSKFAIECKWRKEFVEGKIFWAKKNQIDRYLEYQKEKNIPVFIALGVGGQPALPQKLFVTPLNNMGKDLEVMEHQLIPYNRNPKRRFFYDARQLKLF